MNRSGLTLRSATAQTDLARRSAGGAAARPSRRLGIERCTGAGGTGIERSDAEHPGPQSATGDRPNATAHAPIEVASLDLDGRIVSVNQAWLDFAVANDGDVDGTGVGSSYLDACDRDVADPAAAAVGTAIRAAVRGELAVATSVEVPCHSESTERWYQIQVTTRYEGDGRRAGATVAVVEHARPCEAGATVPAALFDLARYERELRHRDRHEQLTRVVARVSQSALVASDTAEIHRVMADGIAELMDAHHVAFALPEADGTYRVVAAHGPLAAAVARGEVHVIEPAFVAAVASSPGAVRVTAPPAAAERMPGGVGPVAALPIGLGGRSGAMTVMRRPGAPDFSAADLALLDEIGHQLGLVAALGDERRERERLALVRQRQRIARELHDSVVQDLVSIGMLLGAGPPEASAVGDLRELIRRTLEGSVARLRAMVFDVELGAALELLGAAAPADRGAAAAPPPTDGGPG